MLAAGKYVPQVQAASLGRRLRTISHRRFQRPYAVNDQNMPSDEDFTKAALHEAVVLYMRAKEMADQQTRRELIESWNIEAHQQTPDSAQGSSVGALYNFLLEQGLNSVQAGRLSKEVLSRDANCSVELLAAQLSRLYRILPEADVPLLVYNDSSILDLDVNLAVRNLVTLVEAFEKRDVVGMVTKQPCLLLKTDLDQRVDRTVGKLVQLHPSQSSRVVKDIIEEYPELLMRMDYYKDVRTIDELPIEIQNMMVIADMGIGHLHRYYSNKRKGIS